MSISVTCPECFMEYSVPERFAGRKIKCKTCGAAIPVSKPGAAAEPDDLDDFGPAFSPPGLPPRPGQVRPAAPAAASARPKKKGSSVWMWVGGIAGGLVLAVLVCCGGPVLLLKRATSKVDVAEYPDLPDFGEPTSPFPVSQIPAPKFPDLGPGTAIGDAGVQAHEIDLAGVAGNEGWPGMKMKMRVYLPPGEHAPKSLPCVLVAPAGSTLLEGMDLGAGDYHDETLPYAEAGMAVVTYSLDGGPEMFFDEEEPSLKAPYLHFRAACAGVVNTRNALEFALAKLPMVDPKKVFAAGHSSAGTLSLLAAAHEPRLAGALAYAPAADVPGRMEGIEDAPAMLTGLMYPQLKEFLTQSSPTTHAAAIKCPVFLYHSKADDNTPFADSERFVASLKAGNKDVTFVAGEAGAPDDDEAADASGDAPADDGRDLALQPPGDLDDAAAASEEEMAEEDYSDEEYEDEEYGYGVHYESMVDEGLPKGIEWIKSRMGL